MKPSGGSMASHWGPPAQPDGVTHLPLTLLSPHPLSPGPGVPVMSPQRPGPPAQRDIIPLLSRPRSQPPAEPGRTCPASPRVRGCHSHHRGWQQRWGEHRGHIPSLGCQSGTCGCGTGAKRVGWQRGDTGEGGMALMLRGLGWVCLASDAPSTPHALGGVVTGSGGLGL